MNTRKIVASVAAVLTLSMGGLAVAALSPFAAGASTSTSTTTPSAAPAKGGHHRLRHFLRAHRGEIVTVSAKAIGIPNAELVKDLKAGQSIADVAKAHDVPVTNVTSALSTAAKTAIDKAVSAGKLTADQAAKIEARLPKALDRLVNAHKKA